MIEALAIAGFPLGGLLGWWLRGVMLPSPEIEQLDAWMDRHLADEEFEDRARRNAAWLKDHNQRSMPRGDGPPSKNSRIRISKGKQN